MVTNGDINTSRKGKLTRVTGTKKRAGDKGKAAQGATALVKHVHYRGIYSRVARQLGIDRSYVSRVASGERRSPKVEAALLKEIRRIEKLNG